MKYQQKLQPTQIKSRNVVPGRGMPPYSLKWVNALLSLAQGSQPFPTLELPGFFSSALLYQIIIYYATNIFII